MPLILPPSGLTATGLLRWEWLDPTGVLRDLTPATSPNLFVSRGSAGLGSPPVDLATDKRPFAPGAFVRYTQTGPLEINLPIAAQASTFAGLLATVEDLRTWFDTGNERERNPGYLRITRPQDDAVRQIACYYAGGLEGDLSVGGPTGTPLVVSLLAPDPYWADTTETEETYGSADVGTALGVINPGDFDAYPVWTIAGPASSIVISHTASGKSASLTANGGITLVAGQILTIDTRPTDQRDGLQITTDDGANQFATIAAGGSLWWLVPGANTFTIAATGTDGNTTITLAYLPRYRGALR